MSRKGPDVQVKIKPPSLRAKTLVRLGDPPEDMEDDDLVQINVRIGIRAFAVLIVLVSNAIYTYIRAFTS